MKKLLVVLIALLFAAGAFAQEAKKADFSYSVFGVAYGVSGSMGDAQYDYQHIRVRPMFSMGNENIKAVVRLEIDQNYGAQSNVKTGWYDANGDGVVDPGEEVYTDFGSVGATGADAGTDNQVVEVKWAYLQLSDLFTVKGLTLTAGLKDYYYPLVVDNDFALDAASYDFGMGSATFAYIKVQENGSVERTTADVNVTDDVQAYVADITVKAGPVTLRPAFFYITFDEKSMDNATASVYAINAAGDFGMVGVEASYAYLKEKDDGALDASGSSYDVAVTLKPADTIKISAFTTWNSGAKGTDTLSFNGEMDAILGAPDGRLFLLEANGVDANGGYQMFDNTQNTLGYVSYGFSAEATVMPKVTLLVQYGYASLVEKDGNGDTFIGHEFDGQLSYEAAPGTSLFIQASYLKAGDVYADNATQYAWGLQTKI